MGNSAAKGWGLDSAPDTIEKSTSGMVDVITRGTKEEHGGRVVLYNGKVQEW
jgi:norsolorinic acid ketoreductase